MLAEARSSTWALATVQVATERGVFAALLEGAATPAALASRSRIDLRVMGSLLEVLASYDLLAREGDGYALTQEGTKLAARGVGLALEAIATFGQARAFIDDARRGDLSSGWRHVDMEVVRAQGRMSERVMAYALPAMLRFVPELERLARPGARFLDVGLGAAGGSIALCKRFPSLRVVGLEPLPAARFEAHAAIATAGLEDRIEVRDARIEDLDEERVYDGAFVASMFVDDAALAAGLPRVCRALVSGGLVMLGAWSRPADPRVAATSALRWQLWGGGLRGAESLRRIATGAGFTQLREAPADGDMIPMVGSAT